MNKLTSAFQSIHNAQEFNARLAQVYFWCFVKRNDVIRFAEFSTWQSEKGYSGGKLALKGTPEDLSGD